jgi:hypothetical protein
MRSGRAALLLAAVVAVPRPTSPQTLLLPALDPSLLDASVSRSSTLVAHDFAGGLEGWGSSTSGPVGMAGDVLHDPGCGCVRVTGVRLGSRGESSSSSSDDLSDSTAGVPTPWLDSPLMEVNASDATYAVVRMRHLVRADEGALWLRLSPLAEARDLDRRRSWPRTVPAALVGAADDDDSGGSGSGGSGSSTTAAPPPATASPSFLELRFPVRADGRWHTYAVPLFRRRRALPAPDDVLPFTQLRLFPALQARTDGATAASIRAGTSPVLQPNAMEGTVLVDFVRVVAAPTVVSVEGCGAFAQPQRGEGRGGQARGAETDAVPPTYSPTVRKGYPLNQRFASIGDALNRTNATAGDFASAPLSATYNCARAGGDRILVRGLHFGRSERAPPRVAVNGRACTEVVVVEEEEALTCVVPPGAGLQVGVTVANGDLPMLTDTKPFLSYANGPKAPPRPVVSNVAARSLSVSWLAPQDAWEAMMATGYVVQWRVAVLDDHTVGRTVDAATAAAGGGSSAGTAADAATAGSITGVTAGGFVATRPPGTIPPSQHRGLGASEVLTSAVPFASVVGGAEADGVVDVDAAAAAAFPTSTGVFTRGVVGALGTGLRIAPDVAWGPWGHAPGGGEVICGNVTTTVLRGLESGRRYQVRVAALNEHPIAAAVASPLDLYGQRRPLPSALRGGWSEATEDARTLVYDVFVARFDANATLDHGPLYPNASVNALHWSGGEGHYGLVLVGSAHVAGGNATHVCCDGFGGGGGLFLDLVRFLGAEWAQGGTFAHTYERSLRHTHAPLYRFDEDVHDFRPLPLAWAGRGGEDGANASAVLPGRAVADISAALAAAYLAAYGVNGSGTGTTMGGNSSSPAPLLDRPLGEELNLGTLPALLQAVNVGAQAAAAAGADAAGAGRVALPAARPVLYRGRLQSADSLLAPALGRLPSHGSWYSFLKEEPSAAWAGYDDAGALLFVPLGVVADLDAQAAAADAEAAKANGNAPGGVVWPGLVNDSRILWDEHLRGPLPDEPPSGSDASAPFPPGGARRAADRRVRSLQQTGDAELEDETARPYHLNATGTQYVHRDRFGRRLVAFPFNPTSTCRLTSTAASAARAPTLNFQPQTASDVFRDGVIAGPSAEGATSAGGGGGGGGVWADLDPSYRDPTGGSRSRFGRASILGLEQASRNTTDPSAAASGITWRAGDPDTSAPITGRLSRHQRSPSPSSSSSSSSPSLPYPDTTFPTPVSVLDSSSVPDATSNATAPCGPALRLTGSHSSQIGAAWYGRALDVREGFDTTFLFRISSPSTHCSRMHDAHTRCRARGGAGLAFVVQTAHPAALGGGQGGGAGTAGAGAGAGAGLGYDGIRSSIAVEFDTFPDSDLHDPGESHVSVHSRGQAAGNSANHTFALATAPAGVAGRGGGAGGGGDLADGIHVARVVYEPVLTAAHVASPAFAASAHSTDFFTNAGYAEGAGKGGGGGGGAAFPPGIGEWGLDGRVGALSVYLDGGDGSADGGEGSSPVLVTPVHLPILLGLDETHGRAWVGFTAATGADVWQVHDVLAWHFTSLRA